MTPKAIAGYLISGAISNATDAPVYAALREGDSAMVAIKLAERSALSDPGRRALLAWRRDVLARITHPNVVQLIDADLDARIPFMAFEFLRGGTMAERLATGAQSVPTLLCWLRQVLEGLEAIHAAGMVHLDIKPQNIIFRDADTPVIVDFGLSVPVNAQPAQLERGAHGGTPTYMSPEHAQGHRLDGRADLYSVGIMWFEWLAGHVPFRGDTAAATLYRHLHDEVPLVPKSLRHWQPLVDAFLHKSAMGRVATAAAAITLLDEIAKRD
jgi:serine/threonine-protein kinase PpkA